MRISRIHCDSALSTGSSLVLEGDAAHYLSRVLRLKPGNRVHLFNAAGEFAATVTAVERHSVRLELEEAIPVTSNPVLQVHLGLGLSRGERMDYAVQKSTELGVTSITPLFTENGEVKLRNGRVENRMNHWRKVAVSACEQCGRTDVPAILEPRPLERWLDAPRAGLCLVLDQRGARPLDSTLAPTEVSLLVGPEGGLTEAELAGAGEKGFTAVQLGPRVLRTETAPVAALALVQYLYGDLGAGGS